MIEVMDASLAVAQAPAALPDGVALLAIEAAPAGPTLQQALAQGGGCGCGSRGATGAAILDAPMVAILLPEALLDDREPEYRRGLGGIGARQTALWLVAPEAELLLDAPAPAAGGKTVGPQSTTLDGGNDTNGNGIPDDEEEIIITGERPRDVDEGGDLPLGGDPLLEDGNGTGTAGGGVGGPIEDPKDTPCVTAAPEGYDLTEINRKALLLTELIKEGAEDLYEYGAVIYALNGNIMSTSVVTQHRTDSVDYPFDEVPDGAVILALIHNHPEVPTIDDYYPSPADWQTYTGLVEGTIRLPTNALVDPNLLVYLYTNEDYKTRVYDKNDKNSTNKQCPLQ